ncbi:MAG: nucleotidyltransferase family protein [Pseudomonadota bacterium]
MKAMILAAGLGERMRPLTDHLPKPMLSAGDKPLLQYHLEALAQSGIQEVIINLAHLGEKIIEFVGDGRRFGLTVTYSPEPEPLETAGAILHALPLLGSAPFLLINGDVWSKFPLQDLCQYSLDANELAHLILVPNPDFHPRGDFAPDAQGWLATEETVAHDKLTKFTFSGISLIDPKLISQYPQQRNKFPLVEVLRYGISRQQITAAVYRGRWSDVGTPERLRLLDAELTA